MQMDKRITDFLRAVFPFALTLFLWRLALPFINPVGMLALIPVFYCTFVRPVSGFAPFGLLMCFLIDYNSDSLLFWSSCYCLCYAVNGFQSFVDLTRADNDGIGIFALFFGVAVFVISVPHLTNFTNIFRMIWAVGIECALYAPIVALIKRVDHD